MWWCKVICTFVVITLVRGQPGYDYPTVQGGPQGYDYPSVQGGPQGYDYPVQGGPQGYEFSGPAVVRQNCPDSCERYYGGDQDPYYEQVCYSFFFIAAASLSIKEPLYIKS